MASEAKVKQGSEGSRISELAQSIQAGWPKGRADLSPVEAVRKAALRKSLLYGGTDISPHSR